MQIGILVHLQVLKNPAVGKDFMGITWSGSFTTRAFSCKATDLVGNVTSAVMVDSIANGGRVWSFDESLLKTILQITIKTYTQL